MKPKLVFVKLDRWAEFFKPFLRGRTLRAIFLVFRDPCTTLEEMPCFISYDGKGHPFWPLRWFYCIVFPGRHSRSLLSRKSHLLEDGDIWNSDASSSTVRSVCGYSDSGASKRLRTLPFPTALFNAISQSRVALGPLSPRSRNSWLHCRH